MPARDPEVIDLSSPITMECTTRLSPEMTNNKETTVEQPRSNRIKKESDVTIIPDDDDNDITANIKNDYVEVETSLANMSITKERDIEM